MSYLALVEVKAAVSSMLKEPASARFSNVQHSVRRGKFVVCGEVSGRNGFGAYGESMPFVAVDGKVHIVSPDGPAEGRVAHYSYC